MAIDGKRSNRNNRELTSRSTGRKEREWTGHGQVFDASTPASNDRLPPVKLYHPRLPKQHHQQ